MYKHNTTFSVHEFVAQDGVAKEHVKPVSMDPLYILLTGRHNWVKVLAINIDSHEKKASFQRSAHLCIRGKYGNNKMLVMK